LIAHALSEVPDGDVHVIELLSVYVKHQPEDGLAWFHLGDALRTVGRFREAEEALLRAADRAPKAYLFTIYARIGMPGRIQISVFEAG
jgi:cytochrome c-type biogenesis protein CcmH/NrfG